MSQKSVLIYLLGIAIVLSGCSSNKKEGDKNQGIPVRSIIVGFDTSKSNQGYVGVAEEELSSATSFSTNGTIEKMYAVEGQQVTKGTLLAELNKANLQNSYTAAKAMLDQAEDAMTRIQMLYDNESVPEIKYIEMKTDLERARSMEAIAKKNLSDSRLLAPYSGIIGQKRAEVGENVLPNQTVYTLLKIDQTVMIKVSVPEKEISNIQLNQSAAIRVPALNDESFEGVVAEKGIVADAISHTYTIRIKVKNKDKELLPGMVCNVLIERKHEENGVIVIPNNSIQKSGNGDKYVWCIVNGDPVRQTVQTGKLASKGIEIISGLQGGEEIVTEGYQNLFDGATIRVL